MIFQRYAIMNKPLREYCQLSIQKSIQRMSHQSMIERSLIQQSNLSKYTINSVYSLFSFLSISAITYWFYKKIY